MKHTAKLMTPTASSPSMIPRCAPVVLVLGRSFVGSCRTIAVQFRTSMHRYLALQKPGLGTYRYFNYLGEWNKRVSVPGCSCEKAARNTQPARMRIAS
eukprot:2645339-Rhodomonas_salina.5